LQGGGVLTVISSVSDPDPRIRIRVVSRIRIPNADPDPAANEISSKSQKNSYHLQLFD
jgi:hypothetical protein